MVCAFVIELVQASGAWVIGKHCFRRSFPGGGRGREASALIAGALAPSGSRKPAKLQPTPLLSS